MNNFRKNKDIKFQKVEKIISENVSISIEIVRKLVNSFEGNSLCMKLETQDTFIYMILKM